MPPLSPHRALFDKALTLPAAIPCSLVQLALRFAVAVPFFKSGLTKWDGFLQLSSGAHYLFEEEFRLHLFGAEVPFPMPDVFVFLSGSGEIVLPILLVCGLFTRWAGVGILAMTAIIQLTVPDGWANFHLPWAAMALAIAAYGPGPLSLDRLFWGRSTVPYRRATSGGRAEAA